MNWTLLVEIGLGLISVLLTVNAWFIVRLIKSIDKSNEKSDNVEKQIAVVMSKIEQLPDLYHRLVALEKQVAVFEYVLKKQDKDIS